MLSHSQTILQDQGSTDSTGKFTPNWIAPFLGTIDGLIFSAGDSQASVDEGISKAEHIFGTSIKQVLLVKGNVRPGPEKGHEHFVSSSLFPLSSTECVLVPRGLKMEFHCLRSRL